MVSYTRNPVPARAYDPTPFQRVRSEYDIVKLLNEEKRSYVSCPWNGVWTSAGFVAPVLNGSKRVMSDYVVPRFKSRMKAGERFFNNMYRQEITVSTTGSGRMAQAVANACNTPGLHAQWKDTYTGILGVIPTLAPDEKGNSLPVISTAISDAEVLRVQRLISTETLSKRGTADSDLWESAAEYRQVIGMLESPLGRLKDLTQRLLQSAEKGVTGRRLLKEVSDGYLMYRYGITPLMRDIKNILSSLDKTGGKKEVTSRAKEQLTVHSSLYGSHNDGVGNTSWSNQVDDSITVRGMSLDEGYVSFANNLGFSMKGLLMLPLELTSYSFVADWFVNLSSYVQATLPVFGWNALGNCLVTTRVTANAYRITSDIPSNPAVYTIPTPMTGTCGIVCVTTTRTPLLPVSLEMQSDFKFDSFKRVADATALVAGRFVKLNNLIGFRPNNSAFHDRKAYRQWEDSLTGSRQFT